jgi:uncharacterized integral membrane protein
VPDLSHLWQRFVLATALVFGLVLGVAATIFGYSNTTPVRVGFAVFHIGSVPLWTVAIVPLVAVLVAGTLFHWWNSLHHFTEHMRHRRRVHELEVEVSTLKSHLDQLLEMPDRSETRPASKPAVVEVMSVEPDRDEPKDGSPNGAPDTAPATTPAAATPANGAEKSA